MDLESVTFWLKAFIPNSVGELKGDLFALRVPTVPLRFFTGDQREFSADPNASARMHSELKIDGLSSDTPRVAVERHLCGPSHEEDEDGRIIATAIASTSASARWARPRTSRGAMTARSRAW